MKTNHHLTRTPTYVVVSAVRDEQENLARLGLCLLSQTIRPTRWVIVDTGSEDGTRAIADQLRSVQPWITVSTVAGPPLPLRGGPVVAAIHHGLTLMPTQYDYLLKADADVSFAPDHIEQLLRGFERDERLGMTSGTRHEWDGRRWRPRRATASTVEAQLRMYRRKCLEELLPLAERMGWDVIDESRALSRGWRAATLDEPGFRHHRVVGARDKSKRVAGSAQGEIAHFVGYRPSYLFARCIYRSARSPAAIYMLWGFAKAKIQRKPISQDRLAVAVRRQQQRFRHLPRRAAEVSRRQRQRRSEWARADLLLVSNGGGHLLELVSLDEAFRPYSRFWVTEDSPDAHELLAGEAAAFFRAGAARSPISLLRNLIVAIGIVRRVRPQVTISSGSALAVPFLWIAWLFGSRIVFIECGGRTDNASLSRRLVAPVADKVYVQWKDQTIGAPNVHLAGKAALARSHALSTRIPTADTDVEIDVLVTLGTCGYGFDRLARAAEAAIRPGALAVMQCGSTVYRPTNGLCVEFLPPSVLLACMRRARAVACHAGIGSVALARAAGHVPIVVPRLARLNEQVDDHQVPFARALEGLGLATVANDEGELRAAIETGTRAGGSWLSCEVPDLTPHLTQYLVAILARETHSGGRGRPAAPFDEQRHLQPRPS